MLNLERITVKDLIKELQELDKRKENYEISIQSEPEINDYTYNYRGDGITTVRYITTITIAGEEKSRRYHTKGCLREYED